VKNDPHPVLERGLHPQRFHHTPLRSWKQVLVVRFLTANSLRVPRHLRRLHDLLRH
jgi:hypothetical protein